MSKLTRPTTEPSVTCGFYNNHPTFERPRKYDALQMSKIFDGIITDGIFEHIGDRLVVNASSGNIVNIGTGKCWFNHTWTENDAPLPIDCGSSDEILSRIDAVVLTIDATATVSDNYFEVISGDPSSEPVKPDLINSDYIHQYALCYITRPAGSTEIRQMDIENNVNVGIPFITGILKTRGIEDLLGQWEDSLDRFVAKEEADLDEFMTAQETEYNNWYADMIQLMADAVATFDNWSIAQQNTILDWMNNLKEQLSSDSAINLQLQIDKAGIERILMLGFTAGEKTISEDGKDIITVDPDGNVLTKTFSDNFLMCTTVLTNVHGVEIGRLVKTFSENGRTVTSEMTTIADQTRSDIENALDAIIARQESYIGGENS